MEKCMEIDAVAFERASQGSFSEDSPKNQKKNLKDSDFNDVFGGPPRRFSMQEVRVRNSFGELMASQDNRISSPWGLRMEKSVFGEESVVRRRCPSDDFFDDIFRGDEFYSSPRRSDGDGYDSFERSPSSRVSGLAPKPEVLGTSLPAQLSLPAKSTKALDFSTFASQNHGQFKMDGTANPLNSSRSSSSSSRFYYRNPLASFSIEDSSSTVTSDLKDGVENLIRDNKSMESDGNQFHFSIYKWAGKGVPMLTPLVDRNNFKNTSRNYGSASSNGKSEGGFTESKTSVVSNQDLSANIAPESLKIDCEKKYCSSKEETRELQFFSIEEALYDSLESKSQSISEGSVAFTGAGQDVEKEEVKARDEINTKNEVENEIPVKSEMKTLRAYLAEEVEQPEMRENKTRISKGDKFNVHDSKKVKKNEETITNSIRENANKSIGSNTNSSISSDKSGVKGKLKEFVHIFNHEADARPKPDTHTRNQSNKWKDVGINRKENEVNSNAAEVEEKVELDSADKKSDISLKVDENLYKDEARVKSQTKTPSFRKSFRRDSKILVENSDDLFEDYFLVQELSDDHEKVTESDEDCAEMKALDAKIQQWSIGKKGNIRSLLSTLQLVLWPGNGWKPVPLVDLIESNAVKRAYQKALLRLHPDKLQQTGAASHQKHIAEKVFDILQEAWDQFNTLAPI